jgi:hypothetical protein
MPVVIEKKKNLELTTCTFLLTFFFHEYLETCLLLNSVKKTVLNGLVHLN